MKKTSRYALFLAAVAVPASLSVAQYRIDNSQARDANNRIGSAGFNTKMQANGRINGVAGNYIVTGNVTGGRAFRGSLGYTDSTAFRGSLGSASFDNFMRDSIGVSQMRGTSGTYSNMATIQPYFGAGATVRAPDGFGRDPSTGAYYLRPPSPGVTAGDGRVDFGGASRSQMAQGVLSAQRATGGAGLTTSPLSSLSQREQLTNMTRMSDFTAIARPGVEQLPSPDTGGITTGPRLPQPPAIKPADSTETGDSGKSLESALESVGSTGQGAVFRNLRVMDNNTQYAELRKRLDERNKLPTLPGAEAAESLNQVNADILAAREKERAQQSETARPANENSMRPAPGTGNADPEKIDDQKKPDLMPSGNTPALPDDNLNLPRPKGNEPTVTPVLPLEISSLSVGVKDKDLSKILNDAEVAMKEGKFSTAIEAYSRAEEMASDDPLVFVGRSIAELGGGYYRSAEIHLREAFHADPALLVAKFDLRTMLTDARLNTLQADLAAIAKKNEKDSGPLLLLAFVYYNSGLPERCERALEMAQERAGGNDRSAKLLKDAWFPKSEPGTEQSK